MMKRVLSICALSVFAVLGVGSQTAGVQRPAASATTQTAAAQQALVQQ
jgi:hypothetical protein